MLRSGYSSEAVERELTARHFAEAFDATIEKTLKDAGATPALIEALKNGSYQSSPEDAAAAQQQVAVQAERNVIESEKLRKSDMLYQNQRAKRSNGPAPKPASTVVRDLLKDDLVFWKHGNVAHFDNEAMEKKQVFALYFSAHWCAPCRQFTPALVDFYNRVTPQHPEFEVVYVSYDKSPFGFQTYLSEMPWPAIDFAKVQSKEIVKKTACASIPCLVVLDPGGKVLFDTYVDNKYVGPEQVLRGLDAFFAKGPNGVNTASE